MLNRRLHNSLKCIATHQIYINDMSLCNHLSVQNATSRSVYTFKVLPLSIRTTQHFISGLEIHYIIL